MSAVIDDEWDRRAARLYGGYLGVQAILGIVLWVGIFGSHTVRGWVELLEDDPRVTDAFVFGDLGLIVVGSALGWWGVSRRRPWAVGVVGFTAGAVVYPTLYLLWWVAAAGTGTAGLGLMFMVSTATCWVGWQAYRLDLRARR